MCVCVSPQGPFDMVILYSTLCSHNILLIICI